MHTFAILTEIIADHSFQIYSCTRFVTIALQKIQHYTALHVQAAHNKYCAYSCYYFNYILIPLNVPNEYSTLRTDQCMLPEARPAIHPIP